MAAWEIFRQFEEKEYIYEIDFSKLVNYICGNIHSDYSPNLWYYYKMYNYYLELGIVKNWRKMNNLPPVAKYGEMICHKNNELINFFDDPSHKDCCEAA